MIVSFSDPVIIPFTDLLSPLLSHLFASGAFSSETGARIGCAVCRLPRLPSDACRSPPAVSDASYPHSPFTLRIAPDDARLGHVLRQC